MLRRLLPLLGLFACHPAPVPAPAPVPEVRGLSPAEFAARQRAWFDLRTRAAAAMKAGEFLDAAGLLQEAAARSRDHTGVRYALVRALARGGRVDLAFAELAVLEKYRQAFPIDQDPALADLRGDPRFHELAARFAAFSTPTDRAGVGVVAALDGPTYMPECAEPDPATGDLYLSSVHERRILRLRPDGRQEDFVPPGRDDVWSVLGLRLDPTRGLLWATTAATPATRDLQDEHRGRSALLAFRLDDGALAVRHLLAEPGVTHNLGDLAVLPGGAVVASDSAAGTLYILDAPDAALRPLVPAGTFASPQGLVADETGTRLYLADYALGLLALDLSDPAAITIHSLNGAGEICFRGIDGLDRVRSSLLVAQNGVAPARVLRVDLDGTGLRTYGVAPLLSGHPTFDDPTLVRVAGDRFYLVANSHWNHVDEEGRLPSDADRWTGPIVLAAPHLESTRQHDPTGRSPE